MEFLSWAHIDPWLFRTAALVTLVGPAGWLLKHCAARVKVRQWAVEGPSECSPDHPGEDSWDNIILPCGAIYIAVVAVGLIGVTGAWISQWLPDVSASVAATVASTFTAASVGFVLGSISSEIEIWRSTISPRLKTALVMTATISAFGMGTFITPAEYLYENVNDVIEVIIPLLCGVASFLIGRQTSLR